MMGPALDAGRKKTDDPEPRRGIRRKVMLGGAYSTEKQVDTRTREYRLGGSHATNRRPGSESRGRR
jgi:hypothetical protein